MRLLKLAAICAALSLASCASISSGLSGLAVSATTAGPTQATTVAEATQATTLAEKALDLYVTTGNPSVAVLGEIKTLVPPVHDALKKAQAAQASGNSATIAAGLAVFNEALAALNSYETEAGVAH